MNVTDKILLEWSYRCHDGIVDLNDSNKFAILEEILAEFGIDEKQARIIKNLPKKQPQQQQTGLSLQFHFKNTHSK